MNNSLYQNLWTQPKPSQEGVVLPQGNAPQSYTSGVLKPENLMCDEYADVTGSELAKTDKLKNQLVETIQVIPSELLARQLKAVEQPINKFTLYNLIHWKVMQLALETVQKVTTGGLERYQSMVFGYCFVQAIYIYLTNDTRQNDISAMRDVIKAAMTNESDPFKRKCYATAVSCPENMFPLKYLPFPYVVYNSQDVSNYAWIIADKHLYFNPKGAYLQGDQRLDPDTKLGKGKGKQPQKGPKPKKNAKKAIQAVKQLKREERKIEKRISTKANKSKAKSNPWWRRGLTVLGNVAGGYFGQPRAGNFIFGQGDYTINQGIQMNSLMHPTAPGGPPKFRAMQHSTVISRKEYLGDIMGNTGFSYKTYTVQPSDSTTFPWLSQIARNYKNYRFTGLVFYFESMSGGMVSTSPTLGQVGMLSSEIGDVLPTSKISFETNNNVTNTSPDKNLAYGLECNPKATGTNLYKVRVPGITGLSDDKIDMAKFQVYVNGTPSTSFLGELWVTYTILLDDPYEYIEYSGQADKYSFSSIGTPYTFGNAGVQINPESGSNLGTYISQSDIYFPDGTMPGYYQIVLNNTLTGAFTAPMTPTRTLSANMLGVMRLNNSSTAFITTPTGSSYNGSTNSWTYLVKKTDSAVGKVTITGMSTTLGRCDIMISQLPLSLFETTQGEMDIQPNQIAQELKVGKDGRKNLLEQQIRKAQSAEVSFANSDDEDDSDEMGILTGLLKALKSLKQRKVNKNSMSVLE